MDSLVCNKVGDILSAGFTFLVLDFLVQGFLLIVLYICTMMVKMALERW